MNLSEIDRKAEELADKKDYLFAIALMSKLSTKHVKEQNKKHKWAHDSCECEYCITLSKYSRGKIHKHYLRKEYINFCYDNGLHEDIPYDHMNKRLKKIQDEIDKNRTRMTKIETI